MPPARMDAKSRLAGAAVRLIRESGDNDTTVVRICRAAGAGRGAIFRHFATGEERALAAIEAARNRYAPQGEWSAETLALHTQSVLQGG